MNWYKNDKVIGWIIFVVGILISTYTHKDIFTQELNGVHLWRQAQNEWYVKNFLRTDNNILNPRIPAHNMGNPGNILRYEFPIMAWSIAQMKRVVGDRISVTRWFMYVMGCFGVLGLFFFIQALTKSYTIAGITAWCFLFAPILFYYIVNPLSDIWALVFVFWMFYWFIRFVNAQNTVHFILLSFSVCVSGLCKLPYLIFGIVPFSFIWLDVRLNASYRNVFKYHVILVLFTLPVLLWYRFAMSTWGYMGVVKGVFNGQDIHQINEYLAFAVFQWLPLHLLNVFAIVFFTAGIVFMSGKINWRSNLHVSMLIGFATTLLYYVYEINMIAKVHDYYMLPFMVWLSLLTALGIQWFVHKKLKVLIAGLMMCMPLIAKEIAIPYWSIDRNGYNTDWFTYADLLKKVVPGDSLCIILNDNTGVVIPYLIDKQGYVFDNNQLPAMWIEDMILRKRAGYLYSDSRVVDEHQEVQRYLDTMLLEAGKVKVFKLVSSDSIK